MTEETFRKLATIRRIDEILPIEGADRICQYVIGGWKIVDQIGKYNVNDLVVYCEIDSWIPDTIAPFLSKGKIPKAYLGVLGARLKTIKLRNALSQGLLLPLSIMNPQNIVRSIPYKWRNDAGVVVMHEEGVDATEYLNIIKWEPPVNAHLAGQSRGNFPHFIRKTDEERIQNIKYEIQKSFENGDQFEVSLKMDGSSMTTYYYNEDVGVCSRNIGLKLDQEGNAFVDMAHKSGLLTALKILGRNIAVQSELMGPGIQKNREFFIENRLYIYKIWDIDKQEFLTPDERHDVYSELLNFGYTESHVPVLYNNFVLPTANIDELLKFAEGESINNPVREGLVFKRLDGKFSFKIVSNQYLLQVK